MSAYRVFEMDALGHVRSADIIDADTDNEAMRAAQAVLNGRPGELWRADKMICRIDRSMAQ